MKKINFLSILTLMTVAMLSVVFTSCDGEYSALITSGDFVGTWEITQSTNYLESGTNEGTLVGKTVTFSDNGLYSSNSSSLYYGYYRVAANELTMNSSRGLTLKAKVYNKRSTSMVLKGSTNKGYTFSYTFKKKY